MAKDNGLNIEEMKKLVERARNKELFTVNEQIAYSRYKGISISQKEEPIVRDILTNWTYYFKVTAYRKNFGKDSSGKYVNTSFIQLADLAYIDRHLRQILGRMIFEIEHFLKTLIITSITNSKEEDGYQIVKEYDAYMKEIFIQNGKRRFPQKTEAEILTGYVKASERIMSKLQGKFNYDQEFYDCHHQKLSIWALLEVMTLANLDRFIGFYCKKNILAIKN